MGEDLQHAGIDAANTTQDNADTGSPGAGNPVSPYYDLVPKDPIENIKWRIRCRERALVDEEFRNALLQAGEDDPLFFMAAFLWVNEPRARIKTRPFIPWVHQEPVVLAMEATIDEALDNEKPISLTLKKSRAQGGTFLYIAVTLRRVVTQNNFTVGLVTRNESLVDSKVDDSAVLYKVAAMLDELPNWMIPKGYERSLSEHVIKLHNGSGWSGYAATGDVARGGRTTMFCFDEPGSEEFVQGNKDFKVMSSVGSVANCVAKGTLVVTERGLVPIEQVLLSDRVWDGNIWVSHDGCLYKGQQETIRSYRIGLTPDHRVFTVKGWKNASEGFDRAEIRLPNGYWERYQASFEKSRECVLAGSVRLWKDRHSTVTESVSRSSQWLYVLPNCKTARRESSSWAQSHKDTSDVGWDVFALHKPKQSFLSQIRRTGNKSLRTLDCLRELPGGYGGEAKRVDVGANRQRWGLLSGELPLGNNKRAGKQYVENSVYRNCSWGNDNTGDCRHSRCRSQCNSSADQEGSSRRVAIQTIPVCDNLEDVYDLLNCGPRRAFTVIDDDGRPLLVHNCIFLVSTFGTDSGVFYESAMDADNPRVYSLDWKDNPEHSKLAYIYQDGVYKAIRPEEQRAVEDYIVSNHRELKSIARRGHKVDNKVRSPWYDSHCLLPGATPRYIARELDMDARGAAGKVFSPDLLDRMKRENGKRYVWRGVPVFDEETLQLKGLIPREDGPLSLWFKPGIDNSPPLGPFTMACDIASGGVGVYSSNSVASAIDNRTGEQVLEYVIKGLEPRPFARRVVGLALWMRKALLGWEDSGVSGGFAKEVMEVLYYGNVFFRDVLQLGSQKKSRKPGFPCRDADKADMFEQFALAMEQGQYVPRSDEMLMECGEYEWKNGKVIHGPTQNKGEPDKNHGDRAIAAAGAWLVYRTDNVNDRVDTSDETGHNPEYGSFLWRERQERNRADRGSPRFSLRDILGS